MIAFKFFFISDGTAFRLDSQYSAIRGEKQIPLGLAQSCNALSLSPQVNGSDGMFKYEEIVLERVSALYSPAGSLCCLFPLTFPPAQLALPASPCQVMGRGWSLLPALSGSVLGVLCLPSLHSPPAQGEVGLLLTSPPTLQKGGRRASPSPPSFTPSPPQTC